MSVVKGAISVTDSGADLLITFSGAGKSSMNVPKASIQLGINSSDANIVILQVLDGDSYYLDYKNITSPSVVSATALRDSISNMLDVTSEGSPANKISTENSSTDALNAGLAFTGSWVDVSKFNTLSVAVATDQNGTLQVQFSPDGSNIDSTLTRYYRTDQIEAPFPFVVTRQYARIVFTNTSASNQTYFRLQTLLGSYGQLRSPIDNTLAQDFDAVATRPTYYQDEVSLGKRQGVIEVAKFGHDEDQQSAEGLKTIWDQPASIIRPTVAQTVSVTSTSGNDFIAGSGAQKATIYGINDQQERDSEELDLQGLAPATSEKIWLGIDDIIVTQVGATGWNEGDITVTADIDGTPQSFALTDHSRSLQSFYYIPKDHVLVVQRFVINSQKAGGGSSPEVGYRFFETNLDSNIRIEIDQKQLDVAVELQATIEDRVVILGPTLFEMRAETDQNNTYVGARFLGNLYRNNDA